MRNTVMSIHYHKEDGGAVYVVSKMFMENELQHAINLNAISVVDPYSILAFMNKYFLKDAIEFNRVKQIYISNTSSTHSSTFERIWKTHNNKFVAIKVEGTWEKSISKSQLKSIW